MGTYLRPKVEPIKPYTAVIPATMEECEDALYQSVKALPDKRSGNAKSQPTELQKKIVHDFKRSKSIDAMAELMKVARHVVRRWIREDDDEDLLRA
jgi:hypothetical protein